MRNRSLWIIILGVVLISAGIGGYVFAQDYGNRGNAYGLMRDYGRDFDEEVPGFTYGMGSMMGGRYNRGNFTPSEEFYPYDVQGFNNQRTAFESMRSYRKDYLESSQPAIYNRGPWRAGNACRSYVATGEEAYTLDELTQVVEQYIAAYEEELEVGDIFIFSDSEYYYSIVEKSSGKGAMELLVNPYTMEVFPEYGPNMMWNLKYGMHYYGGHMGPGMRGFYDNYDNYENYIQEGFFEDNAITAEEAYHQATDYLAKYATDLTVANEYHEFYGYFTFHVVKESEPIGMLSVNGFTGEVWYHDWHGTLVDIVEGHE